jgi:hypothetical protein
VLAKSAISRRMKKGDEPEAVHNASEEAKEDSKPQVSVAAIKRRRGVQNSVKRLRHH